ncbi:MAG: hypothetical protein H6736_23430, partial [Alphaproteobacteria bacterium]|nr:hypothetical protein [Alphaproteobacteria bacterium]MCB9694775.1 hypothetical protein [Alphaproteobacteria bacterium]
DPSCEGLNLPPSAAPLELQISQGTAVELDPAIYDPDPADTHVVTVREAPLVGRVNGLVYEASPFQLGADVLELEVTDDGVPPRSTRVHVTIEVLPAGVLEEPPTGGCASAPAHGGLLDLVRRRSLTSTCGSAPAR